MARVKAEDFIGQTFGTLTVLSIIKTPSRSICHCKCSCGVEKDIPFSNLRGGKTKTCGNRDNHQNKDFINFRSGKLTVIEKIDKKNNNESVWRCLCDCGNYCLVRKSNLTSLHTQSCGCQKSKGEAKIQQILTENNIIFEQQYLAINCTFPDTKHCAIFDFYIEPDYSSKVYIKKPYFIEFDGIQHYKSNGGWNTEENLKKVKKYDKIKNEYCKKNNIPLIRIPYWHLDNIILDDLLLEKSKFIWKG